MMMTLLPSRKSTKDITYDSMYKYLKDNIRVVSVSLSDREASMVDEMKALNKLCSVKTSISFLFSLYVIFLNISQFNILLQGIGTNRIPVNI